MEELAPSSAETTVVAVLTLAGVLAALGLLIALRRRSTIRAGAVVPSRPTWGLTMLSLIGSVLLFIGERTEYVIGHSGSGKATLLTLHGLATPVYWMAYLILGGLLVILTGALLTSPITLRWVAGPPALLIAALLIGLLAALKLKIDRFDRHLAERHLPAAKPTDGIYTDTVVGADARVGWVLGVLGAALLTLTVVLVVAGTSELLVLVAVTAGLTLLSAALPLGGEFWALRDGTVEWVTVPALRIGGTLLLWPVVMAGLATLLLAIPFLPRWHRGSPHSPPPWHPGGSCSSSGCPSRPWRATPSRTCSAPTATPSPSATAAPPSTCSCSPRSSWCRGWPSAPGASPAARL
ncbi:hypothetical protein [Dactylosporangium cerinum]